MAIKDLLVLLCSGIGMTTRSLRDSKLRCFQDYHCYTLLCSLLVILFVATLIAVALACVEHAWSIFAGTTRLKNAVGVCVTAILWNFVIWKSNDEAYVVNSERGVVSAICLASGLKMAAAVKAEDVAYLSHLYEDPCMLYHASKYGTPSLLEYFFKEVRARRLKKLIALYALTHTRARARSVISQVCSSV